MENIVVIPQFADSVIAKVENNDIFILNSIDIPYQSKSVFTKNNLIVTLCFEKQLLKVFNVDGNLLAEYNNFSYKSIACQLNTVYFGGSCDIVSTTGGEFGEMFCYIDFGSDKFKIENVDLPIQKIQGKSIDDILVLKNDLILVDNIIYPKFILYYDISNPNLPIYKKSDKLPNNGTYEHIIKADISDNWLVLFSSTIGKLGSAQHISIECLSKKTKRVLSFIKSVKNNIGLQKGYTKFDSKSISKFRFLDFCLIDDYLYVSREDGLVRINLKQSKNLDNFESVKTNLSFIDKILKTTNGDLICMNEKEYQLFWKNRLDTVGY
jgi:hypothetical protein